MSQQGLRHASFRAIGGTAGTYNDDARAAFEAEATVPAGATFNEAFMLWLQARLTSSTADLPGLMQEFAAAAGATNWGAVGTLEVEFRYVRLVITKRKAANANPDLQFSEFELLLNGVAVDWDTATATNPGGSNPVGEEPGQAIDGDTGTKFLDGNFTSADQQVGETIFVVDAGEGDTFVFNGYRYATANDATYRDPVSWTIEGSADNTNWTVLSTVVDAAITDDRQTFTQNFSL